MNRDLTAYQSRSLAVFILFVLLIFTYLLLVEPVWTKYLDNSDQINTLSQRLNRFQILANEYDALTEGHQQLLQSYRAKGYLLKGDSFSLAAADLQSFARTMIDRAGGTLISTQPLKTSETSKDSVKVRVKMKGDIRAVKETLQGIETGQLLLLVDHVSIVKNRRRRSRTSTDTAGLLQLHFDLIGFVSGDQDG